MEKAVLLSVHPQWCERIADGGKTIEVRKTKPKLDTPFKVYIYCTADRRKSISDTYIPKTPLFMKNGMAKSSVGKEDGLPWKLANGKVIGEFVCKCISEWHVDPQTKGYFITSEELTATCLTYEQLHEYGNGKTLYGWHISNLVIYDEPRELSEFRKPIDCHRGKDRENCIGCWECEIKRPPQSWCYVSATGINTSKGEN